MTWDEKNPSSLAHWGALSLTYLFHFPPILLLPLKKIKKTLFKDEKEDY
jgi:hypothetical protein